jgi:hypothetical protein
MLPAYVFIAAQLLCAILLLNSCALGPQTRGAEAAATCKSITTGNPLAFQGVPALGFEVTLCNSLIKHKAPNGYTAVQAECFADYVIVKSYYHNRITVPKKWGQKFCKAFKKELSKYPEQKGCNMLRCSPYSLGLGYHSFIISRSYAPASLTVPPGNRNKGSTKKTRPVRFRNLEEN